MKIPHVMLDANNVAKASAFCDAVFIGAGLTPSDPSG